MYALAAESWDKFAPDATDLFSLHGAEVGELDTRRPLKVNWGAAEAAAKAGILRIWTARDDGQLVGYLVWYLIHPLDSATTLAAEMGPWFVDPGWRRQGLGTQMMLRSISDLRLEGIQQIYPHFRTRGGEHVGKMLEALGAVEIERVMSLWIGD